MQEQWLFDVLPFIDDCLTWQKDGFEKRSFRQCHKDIKCNGYLQWLFGVFPCFGKVPTAEGYIPPACTTFDHDEEERRKPDPTTKPQIIWPSNALTLESKLGVVWPSPGMTIMRPMLKIWRATCRTSRYHHCQHCHQLFMWNEWSEALNGLPTCRVKKAVYLMPLLTPLRAITFRLIILLFLS